jgi:prepilin-type processing-associated H-X9-DG protein
MPIPIDARRKPASVKVHVSSGKGVDITWADGHASHYDFAYLREECPCAMCNDERQKKAAGQEKEKQLKKENPALGSAPVLSSPLLPMFKPKLTAQSAHAVGNYALQIDFNDGHATGIFSFDYLRTVCPCEECAREFRMAPEP